MTRDDATAVDRLVREAERFATMAETAELMDDDAGAERFRSIAAECQTIAMRLLDD